MTTLQMSKLSLRFNLTPDIIKEQSQKIKSATKSLNDQIVAAAEKIADFKSVVRPIALHDAEKSTKHQHLAFFQYVSTDQSVREASVEATKELEEAEIEQAMREDVYKAINAVKEHSSYDELAGEDKRAVDHLLRDLKRNGLSLEKNKRDDLEKLQKELSKICVDFSQNINKDKSEILLTKEELDGMPEDYFEGREQNADKKYIVTMKYPDVLPLLKLAKVEDTRKRVEQINGSKCRENLELLKSALVLRAKIAKILGFSTYAEYRLDVKMAKNSKTVREFLQSLLEKLSPHGEEEIARLQALKVKLSGEESAKLHSWDFQYYNNLLKETEFSIKDEEIKKYFSLDSVVKKMLAVYEKVLSIRFLEVPKSDLKVGTEIWHEDVRVFQVSDSKSNELLGFFYLDLHPRENKYTHAAVFPLQPGAELDSGRQYPICAMVCNFSKPTPSQPSLLKHDEVVTFFHELGHVMHHICSRTKYASFHGFHVEGDFVEAPSQMLENWCWEAETLKELSAHYETGDTLPEETIKRMIESKNLNAALANLRQLFFGTYDMDLHSGFDLDNEDINDYWHKLKGKITLLPSTSGTWPVATFGHIMGGYDAGYYGYMWSLVYSADMFISRFKKEGPLNKDTGLSYRNCILLPGASKDGFELIEDFLGRPPKQDAFLKSIGLAN